MRKEDDGLRNISSIPGNQGEEDQSAGGPSIGEAAFLRLLQAALDASTEGILTLDQYGGIKTFNASLRKIWNYPPFLVEGHAAGDFWQFAAGQVRDTHSFRCGLAKMEASEADSGDLVELADGRFIERHSQLLKMGDATAGRIWRFRDVTDQYLSEIDSRRLAAIVTGSDDGIISKDLNGVITSWNESAERIFGYSREEALNKPITMLIPADRQEEERIILERLRRGERIDHFETIRVTKDGKPVEISLTVSPVRDAGGTIVGASKIVRDISERKGLDSALRRQREKLALMNSLGTSLGGQLDPAALIQSVTDAGRELSGAAFGAFFYNQTDGNGESYTLYTLSGAPREAFEHFGMPRNTGIFGPTFKGEGVVRMGDVLKDPRYGKLPPTMVCPKGIFRCAVTLRCP